MRLLNAIFLGILFHVSQKVGPTIVIFGYFYSLHHFASKNGDGMVPISTALTIIACVAAASLFLLFFKTYITRWSRNADKACYPNFDKWCLKHLIRYDLRSNRIRVTSRAILEVFKTVSLFTLLAIVALIGSKVLAFVVVVIVVSVTLITLVLPEPQPGQKETLLTLIAKPDNYAEQLLIFALLFGLAVSPSVSQNLLGDSATVFLIARFAGAIKLMARSINKIMMTQKYNRMRWARDVEVKKWASSELSGPPQVPAE